MELTFNELSFSTTDHSAQVSILYDAFFGCCLTLEESFKEKVELYFSIAPNSHIFHKDLSFHSWLKNRTKDDRTSILSMLTKNPIVVDYPYYQILTSQGMGLGYAYENDLFLISFASTNEWKKEYLEVKKVWINDEDVFQEQDISLPNLSDIKSSAAHKDLIIQKLEETKSLVVKDIYSGEGLWIKRKTIFPSLSFCDNLEYSFKHLSGGRDFKNLLNRLLELEEYFSSWVNGDFDKNAISGGARLESETRYNKYKDEMTFVCPDASSRIFEMHCNYGVHGMRLHFFPDTVSRKCFIGYFGKKIGV